MYATLTNATDLYGDAYVETSVSRDEGTSDLTTAFEKGIAAATSEMDSYLATRYTVPLEEPVPQIVNRFCVDIAIYICSADAGVLTDEKTKRYERAIAWLKDVAKAVANLPIEPPSTDAEHLPQFATQTRLFTRTKMAGL